MKLVVTKCNDCGHEGEDLVSRIDEPVLDPCEKCGSTNMEIVTGRIEQSSASKHPLAGSGPWD